MATEEKTLEFAKEKGWDKILEKAKTTHDLKEIESEIGRKISDIEIRAMCSLGLAQIVTKEQGGYALVATELGLKLIAKEQSMELFQVRLFYHPSGDHMDPSADHIEEFFTLSIVPSAAVNKVVEKLKIQRPHYPSSYRNDATWKVPPEGITPEQALAVLKTVGLKVVE